MKLKKDIVELIRTDGKLRLKIADASDRTEEAVRRWLRNEEWEPLTRYPVLLTIQEHTGIKVDDLIDNPKTAIA